MRCLVPSNSTVCRTEINSTVHKIWMLVFLYKETAARFPRSCRNCSHAFHPAPSSHVRRHPTSLAAWCFLAWVPVPMPCLGQVAQVRIWHQTLVYLSRIDALGIYEDPRLRCLHPRSKQQGDWCPLRHLHPLLQALKSAESSHR